jgi:hypothetical protein
MLINKKITKKYDILTSYESHIIMETKKFSV